MVLYRQIFALILCYLTTKITCKDPDNPGVDQSLFSMSAYLNNTDPNQCKLKIRINGLKTSNASKLIEKDRLKVESGLQNIPGMKGDPGLPGNNGTVGLKGEIGLQGPPGNKGEPGLPGNNGTVGLKGEMGLQGPPGNKGEPGLPGNNGTFGLMGKMGLQGPPGNKGEPGLPGNNGTNGLKGEPGLQGNKGEPGSPGYNGTDGLKGERGLQGLAGLPGIKGEPGLAGYNGTDGLKGETGLVGPQGFPGNKGEIGPPGKDCIHYEGLTPPESGKTLLGLSFENPVRSCADMKVNGLAYINPSHPFKVYCDVDMNKMCAIVSDENKVTKNFRKNPFWLSEMGFSLVEFYQLKVSQLSYLVSLSTGVTQAISISPDYVVKSTEGKELQALLWNDKLVGPKLTNDSPMFYKFLEPEDDLYTDEEEDTVIIQFETDLNTRLPVLDFHVKDIRNMKDKIILKLKKLCFDYDPVIET